MYDSYVRAIRWASDRIGDAGIVAFVSNANWIEGSASDGVRACLQKEFTDLYIFHLRGNARTAGEQRRKEKGNVFGEGTRTPIAVSVFIKNPNAKEHGRIFFHDIGDYLDQKQKLAIIRDFAELKGISNADGWKRITPDDQNDWLNQRDASFDAFIKIGDKKDRSEPVLFATYSSGVKTQRDAWCINYSLENLQANVERMITFYNFERERAFGHVGNVDSFLNSDPKKISWTRALRTDIERGKVLAIDDGAFVRNLYRPFSSGWLFFSRRLNEMVYRMPRMFPRADAENLVISLSGPGTQRGVSCLMSGMIPDLHTIQTGQCFPLYLYDQQDEESDGLFEGQSSGLQRRDAITDAGLAHFREAYPGEEITKEDIFYYVYGLLHSPDYRDRYADNLTKELPRIPCVETYADFRAFSDAGRALGDLHVNYETVEPYPVTYKQGTPELWNIGDPRAFYRVTKMKFGGKRPNADKTTVIYNANITMTDIPVEAYDYVVNGKPALEWVIERQVVKTDKASGIVNDANDYANETMNNPAYPLELFQRVITVSLETMKIVRALPKLDLPE